MTKSIGKRLLAGCAGLALLISAGVAKADDNKNVTIVLHTEIANADVCMNQSNDIGPVIRQNVVQNLTELDGKGGVKPLLATSWEMVSDDTWRFHLRQGVKFHDGADFNADAVVTAIKRLQNPKLNCLDASKMTFTVEPKKVDDYTVDLVANPAQLLMPIFASVIAIGSPNTPFDEVSRNPIGTGPYRFASWDANGIVLERFDGYWGDKPVVEKATYVYRGESALRASMVKVGEADIALGIAFQDATEPTMDKGFLNLETTRIRLIMAPPLDDIRVRKALNLSVDRASFIGTLLPDSALPASQIVVPTVAGYNPDVKVWPYDPEEAKRLLDEAKADGVPIDKPIRLIGKTDWWPNNREVLQTIVQGWNELGMNIEIAWGDFPQWIAVAINAPDRWTRDAMMIEHDHDNIFGDASFSLPFLYHSTGPQSDTRVPELDRLIDQGSNTPSGPERNKLFEEAFRIISQDIIPDVELFHMASFVRVSPRVTFAPSNFTNEVQLSHISFNK